MVLLIGGLVLWMLAHFLQRVQPQLRSDLRAAIGTNASRGVMTLAILAALVLMVLGYRSADMTPIYTPIAGIGHLNNLLMLIGLFVFGIGSAGGRLSARLRHPMLWGAVIWAVAHLLVNGDLASLVLFGGLGLWALAQMYFINLHEGPWEVPMPGNAVQDWKLGLIVSFMFLIITGIHWLLDHNPFLGTYS